MLQYDSLRAISAPTVDRLMDRQPSQPTGQSAYCLSSDEAFKVGGATLGGVLLASAVGNLAFGPVGAVIGAVAGGFGGGSLSMAEVKNYRRRHPKQ